MFMLSLDTWFTILVVIFLAQLGVAGGILWFIWRMWRGD